MLRKHRFQNVKKKSMFIIGLSLLLLCGCQADEDGSVPTVTSPDAVSTGEVQEDASKGQAETGSDGLAQENGAEPVYTAMNLTKDVSGDIDEKAVPDAAYVSGTNRFAIHLLKQCIEMPECAVGEETKNCMISPLSVQIALAMAANGADGDTLTELSRVLWGDLYDTGEVVECTSDVLDIDTLNENLAAYIGWLADSDKISFHSANSVWMNNDKAILQVNEGYLKKLVSFQAEAFMAPFDDTTVKDINSWANYKTDGMIPGVIQDIPEDAVIYLINALTFQGKWMVPFDSNNIDSAFAFTAADGSTQTVDGMRQEIYGYLSDDNATGFLKYYEDNRYAFAAILPAEGMTPETYIESLSPEDFIALFDNISMEKVNIQMPKFQSEYEIELSEVLKALGIEQAFTTEADFHNMASTDTGILKLDKVFHKTFIEVDENGTRAAAVTTVVATNQTAMLEEPKQVILNRPFIYAIMDMENQLPIFIGVLNSVN